MSVAPAQPRLFPHQPAGGMANTTVFTANMSLQVHRWFRYSAGFSAPWVEQEVRGRAARGPVRVLDPFAGSGTTLIASQRAGAPSIGLETHPFVARVARAKLRWTVNPDSFEGRAAEVLAAARPAEWTSPPALMAKIYPPATLSALCGLRDAAARLQVGDEIDELIWLALVGILRACSPAGTAQWQYVLPNRSKARVAEPHAAFAAQVALMASDMRNMADTPNVPARLFEDDARTAESIPEEWATLVITSPPYPNNYDYADATRIEMTFLGEIIGWGDLQQAVRAHLVRSCSQHMVRFDAGPALASSELAPIADELTTVYDQLAVERERHGGRKNYHAMVVAYFADLAHTWLALRRGCAPGADILFVVGDSAPYGVYVPVDRWLGELALAAGFESYKFTKLRDRNLKWKNRKHRVPLHEGILHVKG
jgi:hypothetical protein